MKKLLIDWILTEELQPNELNKWEKWKGEFEEANVASIKEKGILVPLIVKKDKTILDGHNRWRTAGVLGIEKVPCIIVPDFENSSQEKAFIDIVQNARRHMTIVDWYKMIVRDYGELIKVDRRGKFRWHKEQDGTITNVAETISKRSGIPKTTVQALINKAKRLQHYTAVRNKEIIINYEEIENSRKLYQEYKSLEKQRSEIRRKINDMKKRIEDVADFRYFKIYFDKNLRDKIKT